LHGQLDRLTADPTCWELEQLLEAFLRVLRRHIAKEEDVLFPGAAQLIDDTRLERLDRDVRAVVLAR
ncbi:MAG TPA: hemerythrin domain-containing protein, partial [Paraburkholderia sp.]|nr:hemerythrin domain-containing protein [Paraburkholderia sp.]